MKTFQLSGNFQPVAACTQILLERKGFVLSDYGPMIQVYNIENGVDVEKTPEGYRIGYGTIPDYCRGLAFIMDNMEWE